MNPLVKYKERSARKTQSKNPWFLETVQNGLRATNVKESVSGIRKNKKIPVQYFEFDRIFGHGAFENALKVTEMFDELKNITPKTKGYIYNGHVFLYHNNGILKICHKDGEESYFSDDTLRNASLACYFSLVYTEDEDKINTMIEELEYVTTNKPDQENSNRRRISNQDAE